MGIVASPAERRALVTAFGESGQGLCEWTTASLIMVSVVRVGWLDDAGGSRLVMMRRRMRYSFCLKWA